MVVRIVEEVALDAPRLVVHLLPFRARIDRDLNVAEVQRPLARLRRAVDAGDGPLAIGAIQHLRAFGREAERRRFALADIAAWVKAHDAIDELHELAAREIPLVQRLPRPGVVFGRHRRLVDGLEDVDRARPRRPPGHSTAGRQGRARMRWSMFARSMRTSVDAGACFLSRIGRRLTSYRPSHRLRAGMSGDGLSLRSTTR